MFSKRLVALAGVAASFLWLSAAHATTVQIAFQEDAGAITPVGVPGSNFSSFTGAFGDFNVNVATGSTDNQSLQTQLNTFITTALAATHVLNVYITLSDSDNPTTVLSFDSKFKSIFNGPFTQIAEKTFIDLSNGLWGDASVTASLLDQATFSSGGFATSTPSTTRDTGLNPFFSVTAKYSLTAVAGSTGNANPTIDIIASTPLPGTLPLLAGGLGVLWAVGKKRKARRSEQQPAIS
jgi:hypothetical protein